MKENKSVLTFYETYHIKILSLQHVTLATYQVFKQLQVVCTSHVRQQRSNVYYRWGEVKWSRSVVSDSLQPHGLYPTRLLCPWDFPGNSTGVDCHFLLQQIFPTQGWNPGLPHCRQTLYHLSHHFSKYLYYFVMLLAYATNVPSYDYSHTAAQYPCLTPLNFHTPIPW